MSTPREPPSRVSLGMLLIAIVVAVPLSVIFFLRHSNFIGGGILAVTAVGFAIYYLGMASGLPGTSGRRGRNVKT